MNSNKKGFGIVTYFLTLLVLVFSLGLIVLSMWSELSILYLQANLKNPEIRLGTGIVGFFLLLLSVLIILTGLRSPKKTNYTFIKTGDLGEIHISIPAISEMIGKASQKVKGVKNVKPQIKTLSDGLAILVFITVNPDVNIPQVTSELQNKIAESLENYGGINVLEVKVVVESVKEQNRVSRVE